jgi:glutamate-5-semialdehyde dehydrogenase
MRSSIATISCCCTRRARDNPSGTDNPAAAMNQIFDTHAETLRRLALAARDATRMLARMPAGARDAGLRAAAASLRAQAEAILGANAADLAEYTGTPAFRDRLALTPARLEAMAAGLEEIASLPDPLARTLAEWTRPNGLHFRRIAAPIGVIGMIYESRPNVGADAAGICLKAGSAVLLRGGSESLRSARAIHAAIADGLQRSGLPPALVQIAPDADRGFVAAMLGAAGLIDLIIPRGGRGLVERVQREARVPVLAHAEGLNHTYIHASADPEMARAILHNAKLRRPGVCGATETLLIDAAIAPVLLPRLIADLRADGCEFRADARARAIVADLPAATEADFDTEWLDAILSVAVVDGVDDALAHIARHGSAHTEAIIAADAEAAARFLDGVDCAVALWNASTQFCDGGEFGFGAEIGIATGRIHARGPVGPEQLTTYRTIVTGTGQVRP